MSQSLSENNEQIQKIEESSSILSIANRTCLVSANALVAWTKIKTSDQHKAIGI